MVKYHELFCALAREEEPLSTLTYLEAIILGLVQGLAEFLPISSSGHLAVLQQIFNIDGDKVLLFTVMLHLGTLVAVFVVYWSDIWALLKELVYMFRDIFTGKGPNINVNETRRLGMMIIVATIPTALIGLCFNILFESFYTSLLPIGIGWLITGFMLLFAQKVKKNYKTAETMNYRNAIFIGIMQGVAITPGISRSGATLFGGLVTQLDRAFAVRFAFLISIPSILGSFIVELPAAIKLGAMGMPFGQILVGVLVAAVSGYVAIKVMIRVVTEKKLQIFSYYTWAIGLATVIYALAA